MNSKQQANWGKHQTWKTDQNKQKKSNLEEWLFGKKKTNEKAMMETVGEFEIVETSQKREDREKENENLR